MSVSRMFWKSYFRHSLGVSWWVGPQRETRFKGPGEALPVISQKSIFVTPSLEGSPELQAMLERMILAIRQDQNSLFCLSSNDATFLQQSLEGLQKDQKVLFFGRPPGKKGVPPMGDWFSWADGQGMVTHELADIKINPRLKKPTWEHLQSFAGLSS